MKKEWILFSITTIITVLISVLILRWLAPGLLGIPVDLQMVQVAKRIPPFYQNIFRKEDRLSNKFILPDPITKIRARPLFPAIGGIGPNDILGFRNRNIPITADIVVLGDSQTYGNNAPLDRNWPSVTARVLNRKRINIYNMSVGGWGAIQYYEMYKYAKLFQPRVIIVAFYTGNDPWETFSLTYNSDHWKEFRQSEKPSTSGSIEVNFPPPPEIQWPIDFNDGSKTTLTPKLRLKSNQDHPAVIAGYEIMALVAQKIHEQSINDNIQILFTIIPTKEFVYEKKINKDNIKTPYEYRELVENEKKHIAYLKNKILSLEGAHYVDLLEQLQNKALSEPFLYPEDSNGHPLTGGYLVIGKTIANYLNNFIPNPPDGFNYIDLFKDGKNRLILVKNNKFWLVPTSKRAISAGWDPNKNYPVVTHRDIAKCVNMGGLPSQQ